MTVFFSLREAARFIQGYRLCASRLDAALPRNVVEAADTAQMLLDGDMRFGASLLREMEQVARDLMDG